MLDTAEGKQRRLELTKDALAHARFELTDLLSQLGIELVTHMDDCDMDYRRFWCHIRVPGYEKWAAGELHKPAIRRARAAKVVGILARIRRLVTDYITKRVDYQLDWECTGDKPKARNTSWQGVSEFSHYEGDTWVYVLSFYGVEPNEETNG